MDSACARHVTKREGVNLQSGVLLVGYAPQLEQALNYQVLESVYGAG